MCKKNCNPYVTSLQSLVFPELNNLSIKELEQLNTSTDCLDEFMDSLPVMREVDKAMDDWITRNEEVASNC